MFVPTGSGPQESRAGTLRRHVQAFLNETGTSVWSYAQAVVERYHGRTPVALREVSFREAAEGVDPHRAMKTNHTHMTRLLTAESAVPLDVEEAMVLALPVERQRACWVELAARVGRMSIAHPEDGVRGVAEDLGRLSLDMGDLLTSLAPLLAGDNTIDHNDSMEDLERAREAARKLVSQGHTVIERLSDAVSRKQVGEGLRVVSRETQG